MILGFILTKPLRYVCQICGEEENSPLAEEELIKHLRVFHNRFAMLSKRELRDGSKVVEGPRLANDMVTDRRFKLIRAPSNG